VNSLSFEIPGRPTGKGRPKFARRGATVTTYTDAKTASYENKVALFAHQAMRGRPMMDGPLCVTVLAYFAPPKSAPKARRAAMLAGQVRPEVKPDYDNIVKAVLDGLQGVAFADDVSVTWQRGGKRYAAAERVIVSIEADLESAQPATAEAA
jgi:Holliday junction resolvase RusA-like endonuclease